MTDSDDRPDRAPPPAFAGLDQFMPELEVVEPDWVHVRSANNEPDTIDPAAIEEKITDNLQLVYDPEIPVNIWELGLIYGLKVDDQGNAHVLMTLTAPNCPVAGALPEMVEKGVRIVPGVKEATVELTWEPAWTLEMASEDARLVLGF